MSPGRNYPKAALRERTRIWIERLHARPRVVRIQSMKRKWGSCSTRRIVTLAIDLGAEPTSVQDVVIVHELLHLKIRNHGRVFKALMSAHVPYWRQVERLSCRMGSDEP
jgi:predicted metal-dependent hydrolase